MSDIVPVERIEQCILLIRGQKVMLDSDLANLYQVSAKRLEEADLLRSQNATLKIGRGKHRKYLPLVFTEQGVAMLSSVLNSERAVQVNIEIMRAFVRLRQILATHRELAKKLLELEKKYDDQLKVVFDVLRKLMSPPVIQKRKIGFRVSD